MADGFKSDLSIWVPGLYWGDPDHKSGTAWGLHKRYMRPGAYAPFGAVLLGVLYALDKTVNLL